MRGAMRAGAPVLQPLPRALEACVSSLILISLPNGGNQRLATKGLSISPDFIASPLHCFVRRCITPRAVPKQFRSTLTPRKRLSKAQRSEQASNRRGHGRGLSADTPVRQHRAHQAIPHPLAQKDTRIVVSFCSCRLGERWQSAARDLTRTTATLFIASPLHCVVRTCQRHRLAQLAKKRYWRSRNAAPRPHANPAIHKPAVITFGRVFRNASTVRQLPKATTMAPSVHAGQLKPMAITNSSGNSTANTCGNVLFRSVIS